MTQIDTLASRQGRTLLRAIYRELRFDRQLSSFAAVKTCWQICTTERELFRLTKKEVTILHPLGYISGTSLWMQEIIHRYYFSTVNSFVYFGAAILLVVIGLYRFNIVESSSIVVASIGLEAMLLVALFVVMYFTPPDDYEDFASNESAASGMSDELLRELGEIGRDYAAMAVQLESISASLSDLVERQESILEAVRDSVDAAVSAVAPNPKLMRAMDTTTEALQLFAGSITTLNQRLGEVERQEVERLVRTELERMLAGNIIDRK